MGVRHKIIAAVSIGIAGTTYAAPAADTRSPLQIAHAFTQARIDFDQQAVRDLTDPGYVEISPLGEVDRRDAVIGFYAPEKRGPGPSAVFQDEEVQDIGKDGALVTIAIVYAMPTDGKQGGPTKRTMRASFVMHRVATAWKLLFAQYTAVRERPASAALR